MCIVFYGIIKNIIRHIDQCFVDIHNRILRHKNYMVALSNTNIIPASLHLFLLGEWYFCLFHYLI